MKPCVPVCVTTKPESGYSIWGTVWGNTEAFPNTVIFKSPRSTNFENAPPPIAFYWNDCFLATKHNYSYQVAGVTGCKDGHSALNHCTLPSNQRNFHRHQNACDRILLRMRSLRCLLCSWCFQPSKVDEETSASLWSWWDARALGNEWGSWSLKRGSRVHA